MDNNNRPRGREKNVTGTGTVNKKGSGLGVGKPVGNTGGLSGRPGASGGGSFGGFSGGGSSGGSGGPVRRGGGFGCGPIAIIAVFLIYMLLRGGLSSMMGGGSQPPVPQQTQSATTPAPTSGSSGSGSTASGSGSSTSASSGASAGSSDGSGSLFDLGGFQDYYSGQGSTGGSSSGGMDLESLISSLYGGSLGGAASSESDSIDDSYTQSQTYAEAFDNNLTISNTGSDNANGSLNETTAGTAREKFTKIRGKGKDEVTVLVYMCGTDLESKYGMGTSDIKEMASASFSDKVHVLVYTGGCKKWQNNFTSNSVNQIYEVVSGGLNRLEDDFGRKPMTDPATLTEFIDYGTKKYPADRYELIFWDHGSGTISGYGYDEKFANTGSMSLAGIDKAVSSSGIKFDFIGFDACLMATLENALILSDDADYLIASEETEPGTGWYYKNWLTALSKNTSTPTVEIGRMIADDFLLASQQVRQGDSVTLSVTDLAELGETVPGALADFSAATSELIRNKNYKRVSDARKSAKEFAASNRIDQVDIVDMALRMGTSEAKALASAITSAVKYNRTSRSYGDAHGLSVYFPYKRASYIDRVVKLYKSIGMDNAYARCIADFANIAVSGQAAGGGTTSPFSSLFGGSSNSEYTDFYSILGGGSGSGSGYGSGFGSLLGELAGSGSSSSSASSGSGGISLSDYSNLFGSGSGSSYQSSTQDELVSALLGSLLGGGSYGRVKGLDDSNTEFLEEDSVRRAAEYVFENHIDTTRMFWLDNNQGKTVLALNDEDWDLVQDAVLSVLYDDGEGFIDLGTDNIVDYDSNGRLIGEYDQTWLALNDHIVAYYYLDTTDNGEEYEIHGYVPALVNGELSDILLTFSSDVPGGYVSGYRPHYDAGTTEAVAKNALLQDGDEIVFICDYYSYEGEFMDNYELDRMIVDGEIGISNLLIGDRTNAAYRLTDIYAQDYWTPLIPR